MRTGRPPYTGRVEGGSGSFTAEDWSRYLTGELGHPVAVRYGRARRNVLVAAPAEAPPHGTEVRMNAVFSRAPADVRAAVGAWLRSGRRARRACRRLDEWIDAIAAELPPPRARRTVLTPGGTTHDLEVLAAGLRASWFPPEHLPEERWPGITWGRRARRSLRLGSYDPNVRVVRVHPVLDQPAVPAWFVRYILFHELLHAAVPSERDAAGRALHHGPEFRRREAAYPDFERALAWEERHLPALIRSASSGAPIPVRGRRAVEAGAALGRWVQGLLFPDA